jgi:alpha-glucosidase
MLDVMRFWLDRGVDGFRVDAITYLIKDDQWRDNPLLPQALPGKDRGDSGKQDHRYDSNLSENHQIVRRFRQTLNEYPGQRSMAGEVYVFEAAIAAEYFGEGDECHLVYNFVMPNQPWSALKLRTAYESLEELVPETGEMALILGSHDEPRLATRYGVAAVRSAAVLLLTLKGTPFIYYGDELGMENVPIPAERLQDPWPIRAGLPDLSRDPARTPMPWTSEPGAGFSRRVLAELLPKPWLPLSADAAEISVEQQRGYPASIWNLYRQLLSLRRARPSLHHGDYIWVNVDSDASWSYLRQAGAETTLVAINFSSEPVEIQTEFHGGGKILLSTHPDSPDRWRGSRLRLQPHEARIVEPNPLHSSTNHAR